MMPDAKEAEAQQANRQTSLAPRPAIASGTSAAKPSSSRYAVRKGLSTGARILIGSIHPDPDQPRKTFGTEADERLAESMRVRGQIVPIIVRWAAETERYVVVDGERRYRAAIVAGLPDMICVEEDEVRPDMILELQLVTNALREDVNPMEQAKAWQRLMESQGLTHRELAEKLGYTVGTVSKKVALLDLPEEMQADIGSGPGQIAPETGYFISQVTDPGEQQQMAEEARAGKMTRDKARVRAAKSKAQPAGQGGAKAKGRGGKLKPLTERTFKAPEYRGLMLVATHSKGIDLAALADLMERKAAEIRAELVALAEAG